MGKVKITTKYDPEQLSHVPWIAVWKYCLEAGCKNITETKHLLEKLDLTPEKEVCVVTGPITMDDIEAHFDFPETVKLSTPTKNCFYDSHHDVYFCIDKSSK